MFAGSHKAAERLAMIYSLLGTCKLNDVNPYEWLTDVLTKINDWPINRIHELLPHHWKLHTPIPQPRSNKFFYTANNLLLKGRRYLGG